MARFGSIIPGSPSLLVAASDALAATRKKANYVCDGTADDVEIQAAIDALPSVGKVVLSEGIFTISAPIELRNSLHLQGMGGGVEFVDAPTTIKVADGANITVLKGPGTLINSPMVSHLKIDGNKANNLTAGYGIDFTGISRGHWMHLFIQNMRSHGIFGDGTQISNAITDLFEDIEVRGSGGDGVHVENMGALNTFTHVLASLGAAGGFNFIGTVTGAAPRLYLCEAGANAGRGFRFKDLNVLEAVFLHCEGNVGGFLFDNVGYSYLAGLFSQVDAVDANSRLIDFTNCEFLTVLGVFINNAQASAQGLYVNTLVDSSIVGGVINLTGASALPLGDGGGSNRVSMRGIVGLTTGKTGGANLVAGQTSVVVAHGCVAMPTRIFLTPTSDSGGKRYWVSAADGTNFTITIDSTLGTDIAFAWLAKTFWETL